VTDRQILRVIGANVKAARVRADLTQECLAELADIHWQTISNMENGKFPFPVTTLVRICKALSVSPNDLTHGLPEPDYKQIEKIKKAMARKRKIGN
jgi:DNA-binding XRE family transcriptional regulator